MPLWLDDGWNQIQMNFADFTYRAFGTKFVEILRVCIHPNCRIRRIYCCDRIYSQSEMKAFNWTD